MATFNFKVDQLTDDEKEHLEMFISTKENIVRSALFYQTQLKEPCKVCLGIKKKLGWKP